MAIIMEVLMQKMGIGRELDWKLTNLINQK